MQSQTLSGCVTATQAEPGPVIPSHSPSDEHTKLAWQKCVRADGETAQKDVLSGRRSQKHGITDWDVIWSPQRSRPASVQPPLVSPPLGLPQPAKQRPSTHINMGPHPPGQQVVSGMQAPRHSCAVPGQVQTPPSQT